MVLTHIDKVNWLPVKFVKVAFLKASSLKFIIPPLSEEYDTPPTTKLKSFSDELKSFHDVRSFESKEFVFDASRCNIRLDLIIISGDANY